MVVGLSGGGGGGGPCNTPLHSAENTNILNRCNNNDDNWKNNLVSYFGKEN